MEKAQAEIRRVVGRRSKVEEDDIWMTSIPHASSASTILRGYHVPPKTKVLVNAWAIGRDQKSWENTEEFLPERFMDDPVTDYKGTDFRFIHFGSKGGVAMGCRLPSLPLSLPSPTFCIGLIGECLTIRLGQT
ncbi:hypothetical protein ACLOJK_012851 [Asimina triloba]